MFTAVIAFTLPRRSRM